MKKNTTQLLTRTQNGFSTIELLIAFSVGIIFLTAAIMVAYTDPTMNHQVSLDSNQATVLDVSLDNNALAISGNKIGDAVADLIGNWNAVIGDNAADPNDPTHLALDTTVTDISPCIKEITNSTSWTTLSSRSRDISFGTILGDINIASALGGDCDPFPNSETWKKPRIFSSHNFNPGKPVAIDVLNKVTYITDDKGKLQIYDSKNDVLGSNGSFTLTPYADPLSIVLNDVDVAKIGSSRYALVVRNEKTNQFQVINVTTPGSYTSSPMKTLAGATPPTGSFPHGWRTFYYDNKAYVTTRETAGFEFHTFDLSSPMNPTEVGNGLEINGSINDFLVTSYTVNGHTYKVAFLATDRSANEIMVLNVTKNTPTILTSVDLPTTNDALNIQLVGNRLYVGRQKTSGGPELFTYNVTFGESGSNPTVGLSAIGSGAEINADVVYMRIAGKFAFVANSSPNEFYVWDISHPATGYTRIDTSPLNVSNKVFGIDYESPYVYVVSQANDTLQILYSAP